MLSFCGVAPWAKPSEGLQGGAAYCLRVPIGAVTSQCRRVALRRAVSAGDGEETSTHESVENGVSLEPLDPAKADQERDWIANQVREWLDKEYLPQDIHAAIGERAGRIYVRARHEGEDLGGIVLAVGTELESMDFYDAFVGAFDVANKVADFVLRGMGREVCCTRASDQEIKEFQGQHPVDTSAGTSTKKSSYPLPTLPSLADGFDKFLFLQQVIDGRAPADQVNAALALAMGYEFNSQSAKWTSDEVTDVYWRDHFSPSPPVIVGENADKTAVQYMEGTLPDDKEAIDDLIDALYGE